MLYHVFDLVCKHSEPRPSDSSQILIRRISRIIMDRIDITALTIALPAEVYTEIAGYLAVPDLVALAQVSKVFNAISVRLLYRDIQLIAARATIQCCRSLNHISLASQSVRSLDLGWYGSANNSGL